ncbi:MAG: anti-sigma factor [Beijerinckiaceae bacterium]
MTARQDDDLELNAYIDGELDPMRALAFERRLAETPELDLRHRSILNLRDSLRGTIVNDQPSAELRARIARIGRAGRAAPSASWRALAASLVVGIGLGAVATWRALDHGTAPGVANYIVANHIRSLLAAQPIDVASSDRHTVKPWFASKVAQSPDVFDLSADGFALVGGRVDVIDREPVATIVYRRAQHLVSVTVLDKAQGMPRDTVMSGYRTRQWSEGGLTYVAVSDLPDADLTAFERSFRAAGSQSK